MQSYELDIKLDKYGNVDTGYYIAQAKEMRSDALFSASRNLFERIGNIHNSFKRQRNSFNSTRSFGTV